MQTQEIRVTLMKHSIYATNNIAATFLKKTLQDMKSEIKKHKTTRRLRHLSLSAGNIKGTKNCSIQEFLPQISKEIYVSPNHEKIQLRNLENGKRYYNLPLRIKA